MHRSMTILTLALCLAAFPAGARGAEEENETTPVRVGDTPLRVGDTPLRVGGTPLRVDEVVVEAKRPLFAASSDEIRATDFELRPHATTQQILNNLPGVVVAQHQGGGKAPQYLVRGFDADHGTDFAVFVDDLPVNLVTHGHGQGYADLNFLIPETVDRVQRYKGPYFVKLGDFANAGAANFVTKDAFDESFVLAEGGSFATHRYVAGLSPRLGPVQTLLSGQVYFTDGPFDSPENFSRYNGFAKLTVAPTKDSKLSLSLGGYAGVWHGSGQIPLRAVHSGLIDRFGSIDPSEGGKSDPRVAVECAAEELAVRALQADAAAREPAPTGERGRGAVVAMTTSAGDDEVRAELNVTPLVDVVLVLLVILLLMAPMLKEELPVELPIATHADEPAGAVTPTLAVAADGALTFDGTPLPSDDLVARLTGIYAERAAKTVMLAADRSLAYARVVEIMDACRAAGIERIGIVTAPPPSARR